MSDTLTLKLRSQRKHVDAQGRNVWQVAEEARRVRADRVAILICDMWDAHTCEAAGVRVGEMVPRMNAVIRAARARGVHILHGPNDCLDFYAQSPARRRMLEAPLCQPPAPLAHDDPPQPVDGTEASDSPTIDRPHTLWPWTRQHAGLEIDETRDGVTVSGTEIYNYIRQHGIEQYLILGVHTNMCIQHRTFGIKQMVRWGVPTALVRDLTDAMYNPFRSPYVSHEEGTRLVVEFIEKFWCPTIVSADLTA